MARCLDHVTTGGSDPAQFPRLPEGDVLSRSEAGPAVHQETRSELVTSVSALPKSRQAWQQHPEPADFATGGI